MMCVGKRGVRFGLPVIRQQPEIGTLHHTHGCTSDLAIVENNVLISGSVHKQTFARAKNAIWCHPKQNCPRLGATWAHPRAGFASSIPTFRTIRVSPPTGCTLGRMNPAASRSALHS